MYNRQSRKMPVRVLINDDAKNDFFLNGKTKQFIDMCRKFQIGNVAAETRVLIESEVRKRIFRGCCGSTLPL